MFSLAALGCQTTQGSLPDLKRTVRVTVISFPPGAVIEVDGEYRGRTPSIILLDEYFLDRQHNAQFYKVFIYPSQDDGYCTRSMALNPYELPEQVSLDLSDCDGKNIDPSGLPQDAQEDYPGTGTF